MSFHMIPEELAAIGGQLQAIQVGLSSVVASAEALAAPVPAGADSVGLTVAMHICGHSFRFCADTIAGGAELLPGAEKLAEVSAATALCDADGSALISATSSGPTW
ncbi:hypothetical protein ACFVUS_27080 [Nocardia sp. NPDC058058]|uniref:hypothetical protein n=1 Tax=Nocardia sp. NPDC058058 TaxID=3346317 RepID=UPI0036D7A9A5